MQKLLNYLDDKEMTLLYCLVGGLLMLFGFKVLIPYVKNNFMENSVPLQSNLKTAFLKVEEKYGHEFAKKIEKLVRLETNHFKSTQWTKCGSAGMVATKTEFPYGWGTLNKFLDSSGYSKNGFDTIYFAKTSDGKPRNYIKFPNTDIFIQFLAYFLWNVRKGDVYTWFSLDKHQKEVYASRLNKVQAKYIV